MPNGIVIIDKPQGWTSMDVCAKLRGILHETVSYTHLTLPTIA